MQFDKRGSRWIVLGGLILWSAVATARADEPVPPPAQTPVAIVVSGRTSTLKSITIRKVSQAIPETFSGQRVKNTEGFTWYVSRHYALKTNHDEAQARHYLTLLELAFPHYVELFGRELPDLDRKRMAIIYAKDRKSLEAALKSDGISWNFNGGGITYEGYNAAYQFPSGGLQYHLRYILLHECTHLYQVCLTGTFSHLPGWWVEGVADTLANHVWDEAAQRLTVNVVDKPTINNFYDDGLRRFQREPFTPSAANPRDAKSKALGGRDVGFLLVTYFNTDVERSLKLRIWRDELLRLKLGGAYHEGSHRLLDTLFGSWAKLDEDFTRWARARRSSFHYVEWGWEQDGDTLMSYGFPNKGTYSQTDLLHPPGEKPVHDPLVMDYPRRAEAPALVGPVRRGIDEPSIGCVLGFRKNPGTGQAGLGFGVEERSSWRVLVDGDKRLIVDGADLGAGKQETPLPEALRKAIAVNGHQVGLTVKIGKDAIEVMVRAGKSGAMSEIKTRIAVTKQQRERVMAKPMTLLSRGGLHFVTPYIDVPLHAEPDLSAPAPPNRWRNPGDRQLYAVYRSAWRLGDRAPASLIALRTKMLAAATASAKQQAQALDAFSASLPQVLTDIRNSGAAEEGVTDALNWLGTFRAGEPTELEKLKQGLQGPRCLSALLQ
jgi:hypothetical protein